MKNKIRAGMIFFAFLFFCTFSINANSSCNRNLTENEVYEMACDIGEKYMICPELLQSIAFYESSYDSYAKNGDCIGIMQVSPKWHKNRMERLEVESLYDPYGNMLVAADYLSELFEENGDVGYVLMKYNGDSDAEKFKICRYGLSEYAKKVLSFSEKLERKNKK